MLERGVDRRWLGPVEFVAVQGLWADRRPPESTRERKGECRPREILLLQFGISLIYWPIDSTGLHCRPVESYNFGLHVEGRKGVSYVLRFAPRPYQLCDPLSLPVPPPCRHIL
ncbi:hypothetical protein MPTK1_4g08000 [Marchantia polymorpha subsp. ruderalis]|uniref:Uncharacterized protein n=2 Tax=Marchantia polymorpha TaxID=3197 RepID=A0AAF6B7M0_MARPO|nr:hypothetical protein MARPO_0120s0042 [Marchantia polymorpha]BBN08004.1 hypothetical protein Mp_4g08000 [Marchantia polymorpha subsp. ruderalis]|eukprot:PTQ30766.1 hypothetical protein MARPO_0120s0042 [Marchantia polymorpha]